MYTIYSLYFFIYIICKNYIIKEYGEEYYCGVVVSKKGKNVQDAHEAIRPTNIERTPESIKKYLSLEEFNKTYDFLKKLGLYKYICIRFFVGFE